MFCRYAKSRAGITLTPHQFRHLAAKIMLDANSGNFAGVGQLLGHKNSKTTMMYAGIQNSAAQGNDATCRLCCKSRKLQSSVFFAKTRSRRESLIRIPSIALSKSPVSLTRHDEAPSHLYTEDASAARRIFNISDICH